VENRVQSATTAGVPAEIRTENLRNMCYYYSNLIGNTGLVSSMVFPCVIALCSRNYVVSINVCENGGSPLAVYLAHSSTMTMEAMFHRNVGLSPNDTTSQPRIRHSPLPACVAYYLTLRLQGMLIQNVGNLLLDFTASQHSVVAQVPI
jgi:hypothetical protein